MQETIYIFQNVSFDGYWCAWHLLPLSVETLRLVLSGYSANLELEERTRDSSLSSLHPPLPTHSMYTELYNAFSLEIFLITHGVSHRPLQDNLRFFLCRVRDSPMGITTASARSTDSTLQMLLKSQDLVQQHPSLSPKYLDCRLCPSIMSSF